MSTFDVTINDIFKITPIGDYNSAAGLNFSGINFRKTPLPIPINRDDHGLTFFTRPQLNLTTGNMANLRRFIPLGTNEKRSYPRAVRAMLDPRLNLNCDNLVDNKNAFIPILTNHLHSLSGPFDTFVEVHRSKPGVYKEVASLVDGINNRFTSTDFSATFRNSEGNPGILLFDTWLWYMESVFTGVLSPYPDMIALKQIDYNTRIYRLVLDKTRRYVQMIACTGASFPKNLPIGSFFNFEHDHKFNQQISDYTVNFESNGFYYNDPIIVYWFNKTVAIFNPDMADNVYKNNMVGLKPHEYFLFNNRAYPRIDPDTMELLWFVPLDVYNAINSGYTRIVKSLDPRFQFEANNENID